MKVFISWSSDLSKAVAQALHELLPMVLHYTEPWLSESNLYGGDRWSIEIAKELDDTHIGIICLTPENLSSKWIQFEAGALAKSLRQSKVIPYLFNLEVSEVSGPLAQFHSLNADYEGTKGIFNAIIERSEITIDNQRFNTLFDVLWPKFYEKLKSIGAKNRKQVQQRNQKDILNELVTMIRSIDNRTRLLESSLKMRQDMNHQNSVQLIKKETDLIKPYYTTAQATITAENENQVLAYRRMVKNRSHANSVTTVGGKHGGYLIHSEFKTPQTDFNIFHVIAEELNIEIHDIDYYK